MTNADDELIGAAKAAEILGVDRRTLSRWAREGRLDVPAQLDGRTGARLFRRADVERLRDALAARAAG